MDKDKFKLMKQDKNKNLKIAQILTFISIPVCLIIYSPFIIFVFMKGLQPYALPLFLSIMFLYNQLIIPPIIKKILDIITADLTPKEIEMFKEAIDEMENEKDG